MVTTKKQMICGAIAGLLALVGCLQGSAHFSGGAAPGFSIPPDTRLAVITSSEQPEDVRNIAADILTAELISLGLQVVERQQMALLMQEHDLAVSGVVREPDYKRIGTVLGVRYVILLNVAEFSDYGGVWATGDPIEIVVRQDANRLHVVLINPNVKSPACVTIHLAGVYRLALDRGIERGFAVPLRKDGAGQAFDITLAPGEGTVISLGPAAQTGS